MGSLLFGMLLGFLLRPHFDAYKANRKRIKERRNEQGTGKN